MVDNGCRCLGLVVTFFSGLVWLGCSGSQPTPQAPPSSEEPGQDEQAGGESAEPTPTRTDSPLTNTASLTPGIAGATGMTVAAAEALLVEHAASLIACATEEAARYPSWDGRVRVMFFGSEGRVVQVTVEARGSLGGCFTEASRSWVMPSGGAGLVQITADLAFSLPPLPLTPTSTDPLAPFEIERFEVRLDLEPETPLPPRDARPPLRIVEGPGSRYEVYTSADRRAVWAIRHWDDGSSEMLRFRLTPDDRALPDDVTLQLVDRGDDGRKPEAWLVDVTNNRVYSPQANASYPLVNASTGSRDAVSLRHFHRPAWLVLVDECSETATPCVYYGRPLAVCRRYYEGLTSAADFHLAVFPPGCDGR